MRVDFDVRDERVQIGQPIDNTFIEKVETDVGVPLPPTYKNWLREYGNGAFFDIGTTLQLFPLDNREEELSVRSQTDFFRSMDECALKDLVVFGCNGRDGSTWAFYTGVESDDGEYPVLWISPYSVHEEGFVLFSTNFERFINIYVPFLRFVDENDAAEDETDQYLLDLFIKYEPTLRLATSNMNQIAVTADRITELAETLYK